MTYNPLVDMWYIPEFSFSFGTSTIRFDSLLPEFLSAFRVLNMTILVFILWAAFYVHAQALCTALIYARVRGNSIIVDLLTEK